MQYRQLGLSQLEVSEICLGTMTFGQQTELPDAHAQLDFACAQGVNFIDCAEMYPVPVRGETYGQTESIVGSWLARQPRDKLIIATKAAGPARGMNWIRNGPRALDRTNLRAALEGSLQRLRTDYVDLYQLHWPERNQPMFGRWKFDPAAERECTPILQQLEALAELQQGGKLRYFGLSNEHPWGIMEFCRLADLHGLPRPVSVQNAFSLLNRTFQYGGEETVFREKLGLLAYSPLAFGLLTGKYLDNPAAAGRFTLFPGFAQRYEKPNVPPAVAAYVSLARRHGVAPAALALAFCRQQWSVTSSIIGASDLHQLEENLSCWQTDLGAEILHEIDAIHLRYTNPAP
ncbi:MAG: aldo/keto reductase [Rhodocyclaceae bacterium]|nr:aldo/keto reductase [Rhodocyclaceae bacterium]MBX3669770.1 aldo/keto reductase [Rhodocyclaceae bacterium]